MTDNQEWRPPVEPSTPDAEPFAHPAGSPSQPSAPFGGSAPPPGGEGWTPPPKMGLIPLRPLDFGTILTASFRVLRRNPKPTFGLALIVYGAITIVSILVTGLVSFAAISRIATAADDSIEQVTAGGIAAIILSGLVTVLVSIIGTAILQGVLVVEVARGALGEKLTLRALLRRTRGRIGALIGWAALLSLAVFIGLGILVALVALLIVSLGIVGIVLGVLLAIFGGLGLLAVGVWLGTKLSLVPSAIVLERVSIRDAMRRSWSLTTLHFWRVFGIQLLVSVIINVALQIVATPFTIASSLSTAMINPNNVESGTAFAWSIVLLVVSYLVTMVFGALGSVIMSATPALLYVDLRMRKEGLDLELIRYVEQSQSSSAPLPDPYLRETASGPHATDTGATVFPATSESPWT